MNSGLEWPNPGKLARLCAVLPADQTFPALLKPVQHRLAPLQEVMLRDSIYAPDSGYHVEQVEIVFSQDFPPEKIAAAWMATVAATEALRITFEFTHGIPAGFRFVTEIPVMTFAHAVPDSWELWLESDRCRSLLFPDRAPWRIVHWPLQRRLIWTFHHALLDGRSISRILHSFLNCLAEESAPELRLSTWFPPSLESIDHAARIFRDMSASTIPRGNSASPGPAVICLGSHLLEALLSLAAKKLTTAPTLITWAWGQAVAGLTDSGEVIVEQIRAGMPQPGTAGFTMNLLPLRIVRSGLSELPDFHAQLLSLRQIESVSCDDFPCGVYPDTDALGASTLMVEHATLKHSVGDFDFLESLILHERRADTTLATAYLLPDLRLEVEGADRHELLAAWIAVLKHGISQA